MDKSDVAYMDWFYAQLVGMTEDELRDKCREHGIPIADMGERKEMMIEELMTAEEQRICKGID